MASEFRKFEASDDRIVMAMSTAAPLDADENDLLTLLKRKVSKGYVDASGRYFGPSKAGAATGDVLQSQQSASVMAEAATDVEALWLTRIQAGDLITAAFANRLIDAILELDGRLRRIENYSYLGTSSQQSASVAEPAPQPEPQSAPQPAPGTTTAAPPRKKDPFASYKKRGDGYVMTIEAEDIGRGTVKGVRVGDRLFKEEEINFYDDKMTVVVDAKPAEDTAVVIEKTNKAPVAVLATPAVVKKSVGTPAVGVQRIER